MEIVFGKHWFRKHQKFLLNLLNFPILKIWFRWVLRIRKCDLPLKTRILEIGPNFFSHSAKLKGDKVELQTSFRSNEKYARRLRYAFAPVWWAMHFWDWLVADRFIPSFSFQFSTLTAYPQSGGGGGNTTCDGEADRSAAQDTFANLRAGAGTGASTADFSQGPYLLAGTTSTKYTDMLRFGETFDTSALTSSATISSAVLSLYYNSKANGLGSPEIDTVSFSPANNNNVVAGDFVNFGTTPFASITYANWTAAQYNAFTLDAGGIANISKTGISRFGQRLNWDTDNSFTGVWSSGAFSQIGFLTSETSGTTQDPKIDITYTLPSASYMGLLLMGVG